MRERRLPTRADRRNHGTALTGVGFGSSGRTVLALRDWGCGRKFALHGARRLEIMDDYKDRSEIPRQPWSSMRDFLSRVGNPTGGIG